MPPLHHLIRKLENIFAGMAILLILAIFGFALSEPIEWVVHKLL